MRAFMTSVALAIGLWLPATAEEPKKDTVESELKLLQGLWQSSPGGMEHRDGKQVVRNPVLEGPCFFIAGDRLINLDAEGKPTGKEEKITLDVKADPKRITLTPVGEKNAKPTHGIYSATGSSLIIHLGLDGGPAPKQFLELNKPVKGVDGSEWLVHRKKLQGK
jgi:uncharacterized protein (TIGR03067 family)